MPKHGIKIPSHYMSSRWTLTETLTTEVTE